MDTDKKSKTQLTEKASIKTIDRESFNIKQVTLRVVSPITAKRPFVDATMGPFQKYEFCFVQLKDDEGFVGESEFPMSAVYLLKNLFTPILLESPKMAYPQLYEKLFWKIRNEGFRGSSALALGHLDKIFYDLAAKRQNEPVYKYMGSECCTIDAYASGGGINLIGNDLLEECLRWEEEGYKTIKVKFGGLKTSVKQDISRILSVREALRTETHLAVDANQSMSFKKAKELVRELQYIKIAWLEEPIHSASLVEIEELCKLSPLKISYGESERSAKVFPSIIRAGVQHLQPIAGHINSITDWLTICDLARKHELDFTSGGNSYYNCQFVSVASDIAQLEYLEPVLGVMEGIFSVRPEIKGGSFILSDSPGIGAEIDWKRLAKEKRIADKKIWK